MPVTTTPEQSQPQAGDDFVPTEELVRRQGVRPIDSVNDLGVEDPFESDEECAAFLADLYESRRSSVS